MMIRWFFVVVCSVFLIITFNCSEAAKYQMHGIGAGVDISFAFGINAKGQVVGWGYFPGSENRHAFLWKDDKVIDLGTLGGKVSEANGINDKGQVVGDSEINTGATHAFLWDNGKMHDLGTFGGDASFANAINNRIQIVGYYCIGKETDRAFLYQGGKVEDLGNLDDGHYTIAYSINDKGQVVGHSSATGGMHEFLWQNRKIQDLKCLSGGSRSRAFSINNKGIAVGESDVNDVFAYQHACIWDKDGLKDLGSLHDSDTHANGINNVGQVVGVCRKNGLSHACLWQNGTALDIGELTAKQRSCAYAINDRGWIAGQSDRHAVLWIPVP